MDRLPFVLPSKALVPRPSSFSSAYPIVCFGMATTPVPKIATFRAAVPNACQRSGHGPEPRLFSQVATGAGVSARAWCELLALAMFAQRVVVVADSDRELAGDAGSKS
ncbi:MAG: hypothetical protein JWN00_3014 [Actinomycetia bacterium]|jgi:hypothetical protein|nr:hypothetical protein [Actinomycetes bacterium]